MSDKRLDLKRLFQIGMLCLIAATLLFIFVQSILPPETSGAESDAVGDFIGEIIPPETELGGFVQINLRKIAHFVEFSALGLEASIYLVFFTKNRNFKLFSFPTALITALFDETIQIFSGRGHSVLDVWIDFSGFVFASVTVYFVYYLTKRLLNLYKEKGRGANG